MVIFRCKMCGGDLEIRPGESVATCEYCGTTQTLPKLDDDRRSNLYDRANHFRRNNEFDKAMGIYEQILNEDGSDAEAYWSLVLCRYGIEYVEDPSSHKRIPTVNRAQYTSIYADENYKAALEHADAYQREIYEAEAKAIDEIQKGILEISSKEEPFDVFICYKETDANGRRTVDSVLATDLYHQLTQEGFKVFFSRITLEDKLGVAYEPYIFAALNSAKVMIALGTKPEYFNAVWVKNEWSRYLALVKQSGGKKTLIPAYRDMDPYDLPEEFSHLQAQDMSKLGFMQDLIRGIKKILQQDEPKTGSTATVIQNVGGPNVQALLMRGHQKLEDHEWKEADNFFDQVLNMDAQCAEAFFGKALAAAQCDSGEKFVLKRINLAEPKAGRLTACEKDTVRIEDAAAQYAIPGYLSRSDIRRVFSYDDRFFDSVTLGWEQCIVNEKCYWEQTDRNLSRALRYAKGDTAQKYQTLQGKILAKMEEKLSICKSIDADKKEQLAQLYAEKMDEASRRAAELYETAKEKRHADYLEFCHLQETAVTESDYFSVSKCFMQDGMRGYEDCEERSGYCFYEAKRLKHEKEEKLKAEAREAERLKKEEEAKAAAEKAAAEAKATAEKAAAEAKAVEKRKKTKKILAVALTALGIVAAVIIVYTTVIIPKQKQKQAAQYLEAGKYDEAYQLLEELGDTETVRQSKADRAKELLAAKNYDQAYALLQEIGDTETIKQSKASRAKELLAAKNYDQAYALLQEIGDTETIKQSKASRAKELLDAKGYDQAYALLQEIGDTETIKQSKASRAKELLDVKDYDAAYALFMEIGDTTTIKKSKFDRAKELLDVKDYDAAYALLQEIDDIETIKKNKYERATALLDSGDYEQAYALLDGLGYKDSEDKVRIISLQSTQVGDSIVFGSYPQYNNESKRKVDIEWLVLAKKDDRILVISKYGLETQNYNSSAREVTWETCSLRQWLNGTFLNTAFTPGEQKQILSSTVTADKNPKYNISTGEDTNDKIFLLSIQEANQYFKSDQERCCEILAYVKNNRETYAAITWWLRTPGADNLNAAAVKANGVIEAGGYSVNQNPYVAVRPAMWITLKP